MLSEREVFEQALAIDDPSLRSDFLDRVCGMNGHCRSHLDGLLRASSDLGDFLESPHRAVPVHEANVHGTNRLFEPPGSVVDRYALRECLGEGGCGVVFRAEQLEPLRRDVALKVIKPGMDTAAVVARFQAERQSLARMDHPNIARVFDGGTTSSGRPYFVMELVRGRRITDYCDHAKLSTEARLRHFLQVCRAIQHAHQKGVIHRDIKPSNVLVTEIDGAASVRVIDFGIAKAIRPDAAELPSLTQVEQIIGTPAYMSPEQAESGAVDIDTRSDVYSLGALLYELLTGVTPFESLRKAGTSIEELRRAIRDTEPPTPSTRFDSFSAAEKRQVAAMRGEQPPRLAGMLRGDLDAIVLKCLEKDRDRRYETVEALQQDIGRYLACEPVLAKRPSVTYRFAKFVRRNRIAVFAAACGLLLASGTIAVLSVGIVAIEGERQRTAGALDRESRERQEKEVALAAELKANSHATEALRKLTDGVVNKLLDRREQFGREEKAFLADVLRLYEEFTQTQGDIPASRALRADAYLKIAQIRNRFGERQQAGSDYRQGIALIEPLAAESPGASAHQGKLAAAYRGLGSTLRSASKRIEAEAAIIKAVELNERLMREAGGLFDARINYMRSLNDLANLFGDEDRHVEAEAALRRALAASEGQTPPATGRDEFRKTLASTHNNLGLSLREQERYAEAIAAHEAALAIHRSLHNDDSSSAEAQDNLARSYSNVSAVYSFLHRRADAADALNQALTLRRRLCADYPATPKYRVGLGAVLVNLGRLDWLGKNPTASIERYNEAIGILANVLRESDNDGQAHEFLTNAYENRAHALESIARNKEAADDWARVAAMAAKELRPALNVTHGRSLLRANRPKDAVAIVGNARDLIHVDPAKLIQAANDFKGWALPSEPEEIRRAVLNAGDRLALAALGAAQRVHAADPHREEQYLAQVGVYFQTQGRFAEAEPHFREAFRRRHARRGEDAEATAHAAKNLGHFLSDWCWAERESDPQAAAVHGDEAIGILRRSLATRLRKHGPRDDRVIETQQRLGFALMARVVASGGRDGMDRMAALREAEPLFLESWTQAQNQGKWKKSDKRTLASRVIQLYEIWASIDHDSTLDAKTAKWKETAALQ
jgi:serine/threonine protein kinase/tetratricopeptide (TPR) repeat protein